MSERSERDKKYAKTEKGRARANKYGLSEKGKEAQKRWRQSEAGRAKRAEQARRYRLYKGSEVTRRGNEARTFFGSMYLGRVSFSKREIEGLIEHGKAD